MKNMNGVSCKSTKKLLVTAVAVICALLMSALALFASAKDDYTRVELKKFDAINVGSVRQKAAAELPSKYSLVDEGRVTSVKNQGDYGTCWAFAAISASESALITEYDSFDNTLDLSELHLAYYTYNRGSDPLNLISNDYLKVYSIFSDYLDEGGNIYMATFSLARWSGVAYERDMPYSTAASKQTPDASLQYGKDVAHLENALWYDATDTAAVKAGIIKYGAAALTYYCDDFIFYNEKTSSYYCDVANSTTAAGNHAVTVVGWDDNYERTNFGGATGKRSLPKKNGAWLIKNSYSADYGIDGYMWLSYEDKSLIESTVTVFDYAGADNYDYNYQLDGGASITYYETDGSGGMANVFTPQNDEILKAVSFYTLSTDTSYTVRIYTDVKDGSPVSGTYESAATAKGVFNIAGYHTVTLPSAVTLDKGQKYSVVVTLKKEDGSVQLMTDCMMFNGGNSYNITNSKPGESFICTNGKEWTDIFTKVYQNNFRIKAFTDAGIVKPTSIKFNSKIVRLSTGDTAQLEYTILPKNSTGRATWKSSDKSVAKVSSTGVVTAVSNGSCYITLKTAYGNQLAVCTVTVGPKKVGGLSVSVEGYNSYTITWNAADSAEKYQIYKYNKATEKYEYVNQTSGTSYRVSGLSQGEKGRYKVRGYCVIDGTRCYGPFSDGMTACTKKAMSKSLKFSGTSRSSVLLKWKSAGDVAGYRIYMKTADGKYKLIKTTTAVGYKITGLKAGTKYCFKVSAIVKSGGAYYAGTATNVVSVKTKTA